jgi:hypothetical protein
MKIAKIDSELSKNPISGALRQLIRFLSHRRFSKNDARKSDQAI